MAIRLKETCRGYVSGDYEKRFIRIAEAALMYNLTEEDVINYATAAGALYNLPRISLISIREFENFMKHLIKVPGTNKIVEQKYVRIGEGSIMYSIGYHRFIEMAKAAGAVYKIYTGGSGAYIIQLEAFDEYMEQFRLLPGEKEE